MEAARQLITRGQHRFMKESFYRPSPFKEIHSPLTTCKIKQVTFFFAWMPSCMKRTRAAVVEDIASLQAGSNYFGRCYQVILFNICLLSRSQAGLCPESNRSYIATYIWHRANITDFLMVIISWGLYWTVTWLLSAQRINTNIFLLASFPLQNKKKQNPN